MPTPFIAAVLPALVNAVPSLIRIFGSGARAEANAKAAEIVVAAAKEATGSINEQELLEKIEKKDPEVIQAVEQAVQSVWYEIAVDSGGIEGARVASKEVQVSFIKQPAFWITILLLPLPYAVVSSVLGIWPTGLNYSDEIRVMVVTAVISGVLSGITGFWLGTSFSSSRKTELLGRK
jgi:hypothetical protein